MRKFIFTFIIAINIHSSYAQIISDLPPDAEPGKCYAKCYLKDVYEEVDVSYPVFTGDVDASNDSTLEKIAIILDPEKLEWVKKTDQRSNGIWCKIEIPAQIEEIVMVTDTFSNRNFVVEHFTVSKLKEKRDFTEWRKVVCGSDLDFRLISNIQSQLKLHNCYQGDINGIYNEETKNALKKFQYNHFLPIGQLDYETLDSLGVVY